MAYVELALGREDDASGNWTHVPSGIIRDLLLAALLPGGQTLRGPARGFARPDVRSGRLTLHCPALPVWLNWIDVRGLRLGDARVDLLVSRAGEGARLEQFEREGEVDVVFSL